MTRQVTVHGAEDARVGSARRPAERPADATRNARFGVAALIALQRQADNGAVTAAINEHRLQSLLAIQRCGSEKHAGCSCVDSPAEEAVQRVGAERPSNSKQQNPSSQCQPAAGPSKKIKEAKAETMISTFIDRLNSAATTLRPYQRTPGRSQGTDIGTTARTVSPVAALAQRAGTGPP